MPLITAPERAQKSLKSSRTHAALGPGLTLEAQRLAVPQPVV